LNSQFLKQCRQLLGCDGGISTVPCDASSNVVEYYAEVGSLIEHLITVKRIHDSQERNQTVSWDDIACSIIRVAV